MTEAISKQLSYVLRHRPDAIGIALDRAGWVAVDELLAALARHGTALSRPELEAIVAGSDKRRFALSPDGTRIRALYCRQPSGTSGISGRLFVASSAMVAFATSQRTSCRVTVRLADHDPAWYTHRSALIRRMSFAR